jgi:hypothetical protein
MALALPLAPALAQQQAAPDVVTKPLLDNDDVRVLDMRLSPGARTATLSHPNRFIYALSDGALVFTPPGRTSYELSFQAGEVLWLPAQATATANEGSKEVHVVVVELKRKIQGPPRKSATAGRAKGKSSKSVSKSGSKSGTRAK